jgi:hemerythrin-like metal-binding protein
MSIHWNDSLATGAERIDAEHRVFVALIRELEQADGDGLERARIVCILREIHAYAVFHFVREENLMAACGYPGHARHRREHQELLAHFADILQEYRDGRVLVQHIVELTFNWFADHAMDADQRLADFLRQAR